MLTAAIEEAHIHGVSTRSVDDPRRAWPSGRPGAVQKADDAQRQMLEAAALRTAGVAPRAPLGGHGTALRGRSTSTKSPGARRVNRRARMKPTFRCGKPAPPLAYGANDARMQDRPARIR